MFYIVMLPPYYICSGVFTLFWRLGVNLAKILERLNFIIIIILILECILWCIECKRSWKLLFCYSMYILCVYKLCIVYSVYILTGYMSCTHVIVCKCTLNQEEPLYRICVVNQLYNTLWYLTCTCVSFGRKVSGLVLCCDF